MYGGFDFVWGRKSLRLTDMKGSDHSDGGDDNVDMTQKIWPKKQMTTFWLFFTGVVFSL